MTTSPRPGRLTLSCFLLCLLSSPAHAQQFDPAYTRFGFEVRTRWSQRVHGTFPRYDGEVERLPDGRGRVRIRLETAAVEVAGSASFTALARGEGFFDAVHYPQIEFVSDPYDDQLARNGGHLRGRLTLHGITREERFELEPAQCARPGRDCDAVATGTVSRDDYRLDGWQFALSNRVRFSLRVRLQEPLPGPLL